ncbi:unnamed protein product [Angiostrongylus costaricensis]|uniref:SCP domain-containing protein n=1 Tax=Angiostrongylus costaricensis TaxID=334426 RepID=A0A0R3PHC4_ANGCS|nr:unnamed protein product [Angiostrongylus costaricensis]
MIAENLVQNCPPVEGPVPQQFGSNYHFFGQGSSVFDRRFPIQSAILLWSEISSVMWPASNTFDGNPALRDFVNMILANTVSVGCSGAMCLDTAAAACVFSAPNVQVGDQVYMSGTPCQIDADCIRFSPAFCENGLCVNDEYDCQAEQVALNHVRSCDRIPAPPIARPGYSENIHVLATAATDVLGAIQNAIVMFTNELAANGIPSNMILTPQVVQRTQRTVTRVTKVLWGSNRFVGCATVLCRGFYFSSCMYRNPVNVVGQSIYTIGAVCSTCPTGPNNCNPDIGLCSY